MNTKNHDDGGKKEKHVFDVLVACFDVIQVNYVFYDEQCFGISKNGCIVIVIARRISHGAATLLGTPCKCLEGIQVKNETKTLGSKSCYSFPTLFWLWLVGCVCQSCWQVTKHVP